MRLALGWRIFAGRRELLFAQRTPYRPPKNAVSGMQVSLQRPNDIAHRIWQHRSKAEVERELSARNSKATCQFSSGADPRYPPALLRELRQVRKDKCIQREILLLTVIFRKCAHL